LADPCLRRGHPTAKVKREGEGKRKKEGGKKEKGDSMPPFPGGWDKGEERKRKGEEKNE